ncbi:MAG: hypothetical protein ACOYXT_20440 [Bacteroidota bacterium]
MISKLLSIFKQQQTANSNQRQTVWLPTHLQPVPVRVRSGRPMIAKTAAFLIGLAFSQAAFSQNVGINATGATPDASAMLDITSTSTGLLIPRVALTASNSASPITSPATSLLVYNTATAGTSPNNVVPGYYYWSGSAWIPFLVSSATSNGGWTLGGNSGINATNNFIGTTDDKQVIVKSNNQSYLEFGSRQTLGLVQSYADYTDGTEKVSHLRSALQFEAAGASFYKPKLFVDANGNFRMKGSSAGTDLFEFGATGTSNNGGLEFIIGDDGDEPITFKSYNYLVGTTEIMRLQNNRMGLATTTPTATLDVAGTYKLGSSGTVLNNMIKTSVTINDNTAFNQGTTRQITVTVTGATTNATVILNPRTALATSLAIGWAYVSSTNNVTIGFINASGTSRVLGNITFDVTIIQ